MALFSSSRLALRHLPGYVIAICCLIAASPALARPHPGFGQRQGPPSARMQRPQQEHFGQWLNRHQNMPLRDQQNALEHEPGFRNLPPETQERMHDRLRQLNNMSPAQRSRLIERTEAMERLSPEQREQVRNSVQQLGSYSPDRRRMVAQAFRNLRALPPQQRQSALNSDRFRSQFSDQERSTLSNLLSVEPYHPGEYSNQPPGPPR